MKVREIEKLGEREREREERETQMKREKWIENFF